jgi:iron-sulfur cluster assembly protein
MGATLNESAQKERRALPPLLQLTDAAADRLRALYAKGKAGMLLRIGVKTKGFPTTFPGSRRPSPEMRR